MRVIFLNPPFLKRFSREQRSPAVTKSGTFYYPKWLSMAAGLCEENGHEVLVIDAPARGTTLGEVLQTIQDRQFDAVVCDTSTPSIESDMETCAAILGGHPGMHLLMVGRHVSAEPELTLASCPLVAAVAVGEYEQTVCDWLAALRTGADLSCVNGLVFRRGNGDLTKTPPREAISDLDALPFVSRVYKQHLNIDDYFYAHSPAPMVTIDTSRGCPYRCSYCAYPQTFSGHSMRYRSARNVADEFAYIARELPDVKTVMLEDDTFILSEKRAREIAMHLIDGKNKISISANARPDLQIGLETLQLLKRAGLRLLCVGIDSVDADVLMATKRTFNRPDAEAYAARAELFLKDCRRAGILVHACFMLGHLRDTRETIQAALDFSLRVKPDTAQFFPLMVYPGTADYRDARRVGALGSAKFSQWLTVDGKHNSVIDLPGLDHRQVVELCDAARRRFYLRPSYILKKLFQSLVTPSEFRRNLRGFSNLMKNMLAGRQLKS